MWLGHIQAESRGVSQHLGITPDGEIFLKNLDW